MKLFLLSLILVPLTAGFVGTPISPHTGSAKPQQKRLYQKTGNEGGVAGNVFLQGRPPGGKLIDTSADSGCDKNPRLLTEQIVARRGRLASVFVYLKSGAPLDELSFETPATPVTLDQRRCRFVPHVLGAQINQTIEVLNSDPTTHNVHQTPRLNSDWNQSQPMGAPPLIMHLTHAEIMVPIKCNQHPWMKAYVGVLAHPFFSVSNRNGSFRIEGLPPGQYELAAWHEVFGEKTIPITIAAGVEQNVRFDFDVKNTPDWLKPRYSPR
jgi:plastocyanin